MNEEQLLFAAFVTPGRRERYVDLLGTKRGREKVRSALDHFKDLDLRFCRNALAATRSVYFTRGMLKSKSWGKAVLLLVAPAFTAVAQKPSPGDNFYSLENERKFGQSTASSLEHMLTVVREPKLGAYVAKLF